MRACRVVAVDVGSVAPRGRPQNSRFAWAALDLHPHEAPTPGAPVARPQNLVAAGRDPEGAAACLADGARRGLGLALGLECPQVVPVPETTGERTWTALGSARAGEGNRPWSAGAGAGSMATGLVQGAWLLGRLHALTGPLQATADPRAWTDGEGDLLLWEAFVSGDGKPAPTPGVDPHHADAAAAAATFAQRWSTGALASTGVTCMPHQALNLAAVTALWAGHHIDVAQIHAPLAVYVTTRQAADA